MGRRVAEIEKQNKTNPKQWGAIVMKFNPSNPTKSNNSMLFSKYILMSHNGFDCSDLFKDKYFFMASD